MSNNSLNSAHNLDANLILLSERLASLVQALQELTNRLNTQPQVKDPATEELINGIPWVEHFESECSICFEPQVAELRQMPCGHVFHSACLVKWLKIQRNCPQCRLELIDNN